MKFQPLHVPAQWKHEWSSHPEGYTLMESLLNWVKQVDDMGLNINDWNKRLDEFIKTFDKDLQGNVTAELKKWQESGLLNNVINDALTTVAKRTQGTVSVMEYGAVADGVTSVSQALNNALEESNVVLFPDGVFHITEPIKLGKGQRIKGNGKGTIIKASTDINIFEFGVDSQLSDLTVNIRDAASFNSHVFEISNRTLKTADFTGSGNVRVRINNIDVFSQNGGAKSAVFALFMEDKVENTNLGFYGVNVSNINHVSYGEAGIRFFFKNYCKNGCWITGIGIENVINHGTVWGIFDGENDTDLLDGTITSCIDRLSIVNYQHQCKDITKAYAYIRNGEKNFTNSIPWDWHYATGEYNTHPFLFHHALRETQRTGTYGMNINITQHSVVQPDGTIYHMNYSDFHLLERYKKKPVEVGIPKIIGMSRWAGTAADNPVKAFLVYKGNKVKRTSETLIFQFRTRLSRKWIDITIFPTVDEQELKYSSSSPLPAGYELRWRLNGGDMEIYICKTDNTGLSLQDIIRTEPLSNSLISYGTFSNFTSYYVTANNFDGVYLSEITASLKPVLNNDTQTA